MAACEDTFLDDPYQAFLAVPDWISRKRTVIPAPLKPPRPLAKFYPFSSPMATEAVVSHLKTKAYCNQLEGPGAQGLRSYT
jgi:hypothetical protein